MATLREAVNNWAKEDDSTEMTSRIIKTSYSSEQTEAIYSEIELNRETVCIAGEDIEVFVGEPLTTQEWDQVKEFLQSYTPRRKQCFANAVEFSAFNDNVGVVNGVTTTDRSDRVHDHAWNMLNGKIVDVTRGHNEQYGVRVSSKQVRELYNTFESGQNWSFLLNDESHERLCSDTLL